ncbi:hypothetical protein ACFL6H_06470 [Candidatus Latescibacterota bacterium]
MNKQSIFKIILLSAMVCLLVSPTLMAQQFQRPTPESRVEQINTAVKLTESQRAQILKIYTDAAANAQQGGRRGGFGGGGTTAAIEKVLTPEQVKKWRAYTLQQSVERRINQIDQAVTLTDQQKKKIVPIIEKEINAQNALTAERRAQGENADFEGMRDKMTELRNATNKALESILTKEQLSLYNAMPRRGRRGQ